jgi:Domain of unknown function (DUF4388)
MWGKEEELVIAWSGCMVQQQEMMADRLVHVISSFQRERRSGVLTAKRGEGIFLEEGTIAFANGQVSQASVGRRRGSEALNWLSTWESCRFLFVPTMAGVEAPPPSLPAKSIAASPPAPGFPAHMTKTRSPAQQSSMPSSSQRQEGPQGENDWESIEEKGKIDTPASVAPYPTQQLDAALRLIEQYRLSRVHKQLFFLIDGRRSIVDLVRLTGKKGNEIYKLLGDLERARVIRIR